MEVHHLTKEIQNMKQSGYRLIQDPLPSSCIAGVRVVFFMNPDIGIIELAEIKEGESI